jgi:glycosyltransferase involved in cell wall biosynthesis
MTVEISVVIPAHNRADVVGMAVESALAQQGGSPRDATDPSDATDLAIEIIIVDDGSSDDLATALVPYRDRVRLLRHDRNAGAAAARNTGIAAATGTYVALLDSDDTWRPGKLNRQIAIMRRHGWQASCTAYWLVRGDAGDIVSPRLPSGPLTIDDLVWGCFVSARC